MKKVNKSSNLGILWNKVCWTRHQRRNIVLRRMQQPTNNNKAQAVISLRCTFSQRLLHRRSRSIRYCSNSLQPRLVLCTPPAETALKISDDKSRVFTQNWSQESWHRLNCVDSGSQFSGLRTGAKVVEGPIEESKVSRQSKTICKIDFSIFLNKYFLTQNLVLKPGSEIRELWSEAPFAVTFKVLDVNFSSGFPFSFSNFH